MKFFGCLLVCAVLAGGTVHGAEEPRIVAKVKPLPTALDKNFEFRKTKIFILDDRPIKGLAPPKNGGNKTGGGKLTGKSGVADASINFERTYRMFGALTALDQSERKGHYFDFFWRSKRRADVTIRLEYQQEKLRSFTQAREAFYPQAKGTLKTEFRIVGSDFFDDGRVVAWRCLLIENGRIVAEHRSYLWQ